MKPIVFLGPSLERPEAEKHLAGEYRPPATAGDLLAAALRGPPMIVLIDGLFEQVPAVWHKEILFAIERGVRVYGASSMGALRAAELHTFGMIGVGRIFERYRSGELEDDDEVALLHGPEAVHYRPFSEAMVNIRDVLSAALGASVLERDEHELLLSTAKELFYPERIWPTIVSGAIQAGLAPDRMQRFSTWLTDCTINTKRSDAIAVLERAHRDLAAPPIEASFEFERSFYWEQLYEDVISSGTQGLGTKATAAWARITAPQPALNRALVRHMIRLEARRRGLTVERSSLESALRGFCHSRDLPDHEALHAWLAEAELHFEQLLSFLSEGLLAEEFCTHEREGVESAFIEELKISGAWRTLAEQAAEQQSAAAEFEWQLLTPTDVGLEEQEVLDWYEARFRSISPDLAAHVREIGFTSPRDFLNTVTRAMIAERK